jgi:hypothetical protein
VNEPELEKLIIAATANKSLVTKKSPWRIFQYYRSHLMKHSCLIMKDFLTGVETTGPRSAGANEVIY